MILWKVGVGRFTRQNGEVTSDNKMVCKSCQRYKGGNRYCCSNFLVNFEITSKFLIVFVRLVLGKVGVDQFTGLQREIDIKYEFSFNVILKDLKCK